MLKYGADPDARNGSGLLPIDLARNAGCRNMCLLYRQWERMRKDFDERDLHSTQGSQESVVSTHDASWKSKAPNLVAAAESLPPSAAQLRLLVRHGVPKQFLPTSKSAASR